MGGPPHRPPPAGRPRPGRPTGRPRAQDRTDPQDSKSLHTGQRLGLGDHLGQHQLQRVTSLLVVCVARQPSRRRPRRLTQHQFRRQRVARLGDRLQQRSGRRPDQTLGILDSPLRAASRLFRALHPRSPAVLDRRRRPPGRRASGVSIPRSSPPPILTSRPPPSDNRASPRHARHTAAKRGPRPAHGWLGGGFFGRGQRQAADTDTRSSHDVEAFGREGGRFSGGVWRDSSIPEAGNWGGVGAVGDARQPIHVLDQPQQ